MAEESKGIRGLLEVQASEALRGLVETSIKKYFDYYESDQKTRSQREGLLGMCRECIAVLEERKDDGIGTER